MREIRFRVWDDVLGMCCVTWIDYGTKTIGVRPRGDDMAPTYTLNIENANLMQFTGLFDKHGREIYEGDVVDFGENNIGEILWCGDDWNIKFKGYILRLGIGGGEIIGNIYESPELIK
jgi:uncharacterized phage protein (TIGR01671 family)